LVDGHLDRPHALSERRAPEAVEAGLAGEHLDDHEPNARGSSEDRLDVRDLQWGEFPRRWLGGAAIGSGERQPGEPGGGRAGEPFTAAHENLRGGVGRWSGLSTPSGALSSTRPGFPVDEPFGPGNN